MGVATGMGRRGVLTGACTLAAVARADTTSLRGRARAKGIVFGTEILASELASDASYAALVASQAAMLTPGIEAKWIEIEPQPGAFAFARLDSIVAFARAHAMSMHMHNIIWSVGMPAWLTASLRAGQGEAALRRHIQAVVGRYKGEVESWDVVNEPVNPLYPSAPEGYMTTPWRLGLGPDFVDLAMSLCKQADPGARLLINDDDLEYATPASAGKRDRYLRLVEAMVKRGTPIGGFGLEAHLKPGLPFAETEYRRFLKALGAMGLTIYVTELDVLDRDLPADTATRDQMVADAARRYLDVALDERAVGRVITWGLSDRYTYMDSDPATRRPDGLRARCLPYDEALRPKPFHDALCRAFDGAPDRR